MTRSSRSAWRLLNGINARTNAEGLPIGVVAGQGAQCTHFRPDPGDRLRSGTDARNKGSDSEAVARNDIEERGGEAAIPRRFQPGRMPHAVNEASLYPTQSHTTLDDAKSSPYHHPLRQADRDFRRLRVLFAQHANLD